jgi:hypothetical protein
MPGSFFDTFNPTLMDLEGSFGEPWVFKGGEYPAISIDTLEVDDKRIKGGAMLEASVLVSVRKEVFDQSGAIRGDLVTVRGVEMVIGRLENNGDASVNLICAPKGVDVWRR